MRVHTLTHAHSFSQFCQSPSGSYHPAEASCKLWTPYVVQLTGPLRELILCFTWQRQAVCQFPFRVCWKPHKELTFHFLLGKSRPISSAWWLPPFPWISSRNCKKDRYEAYLPNKHSYVVLCWLKADFLELDFERVQGERLWRQTWDGILVFPSLLPWCWANSLTLLCLIHETGLMPMSIL